MSGAKRWLRLAATAAAGLYIADFAVAYARGDAALGTVRVRVLYAVPEKAARMDFAAGPTEDVACVRALFPHFGAAPCWYAKRHKLQRVDL